MTFHGLCEEENSYCRHIGLRYIERRRLFRVAWRPGDEDSMRVDSMPCCSVPSTSRFTTDTVMTGSRRRYAQGALLEACRFVTASRRRTPGKVPYANVAGAPQ